ncbi:MAG TPA: PLP-dependent aminotransferase family protein [Aldersonia sp.]
MATRVISTSTLLRDLGRWRTGVVAPATAAGARRSARPTYVALAESIRLLVHDGRIPLGVALPSERDLAKALDLSRTTITSTYALLREDGYLVSRQGSRSTVALPGPAKPVGGTITSIMASVPGLGESAVDLTCAAMAAPPPIQDAYAAALQSLPCYLPTHGMDPVGTPVLREAIAARYAARGLPTDPDQILVTLGAQHALRLLLSLLVAPGERVLIDHPTYPNGIQAVRDVGARAVPVPLHLDEPGDGWDLDGIRSAARQTAARMAYLVPDFNNPTGRCLAPAGRAELAAIGRDTRMTVVVDESMAELALDIEPPLPVAAYARGSEIVTIGSVSKSFWGGLRVGWVRANRSLITRLLGTRSSVDLGTPVMDQLASAHLLAHPEAILDDRRETLRARRGALLDALAEHLPDWTVNPGPGGMSLWARLPAPVSTALASTAPNFGVLLAAGPKFGGEGTFERYLRLPYTHAEADLRRAVPQIAAAYDVVAPRAAQRPLNPMVLV